MEAFSKHVLNTGFQAWQQSTNVLNKDMIQSLCQILKPALICHTAVLRVTVEELIFSCTGFCYVSVADDVLLASVDHTCTVSIS